MTSDRFSFVTHGLSDGNDPNAVFGELAEIKLLLEGLAKETAITVDNNKIERMLAIARLCRPGNDLTYRFPLIVEALAKLRPQSCIIDGGGCGVARRGADAGYD